MGATNKTTVYKLPIFVPTDKPTWLGDFNGAMNSIEAGLVDAKNSSTTVIQTANSALSIANSAKADVAAATSASNNAVALATTAKNTADTALATANSANTTAASADTKASSAVTTANAASSNATQALTVANGLNADPAQIFGVSRATNNKERMPSAPVSFAMSPLNAFGMTWVAGSQGYRVDKAGVYLLSLVGTVASSEHDGSIYISKNTAGTVTHIRRVNCEASPYDVPVDLSIVRSLAVGDIITVYGDNAVFYGGPASNIGIELNIARLGA